MQSRNYWIKNNTFANSTILIISIATRNKTPSISYTSVNNALALTKYANSFPKAIRIAGFNARPIDINGRVRAVHCANSINYGILVSADDGIGTRGSAERY
jgi:hypothetical protein